MVDVAVHAVPVVALLVLLAMAHLQVSAGVEALVSVACAGAALATGGLDLGSLHGEVGHLLPVVVFLMAVLVVAECCRAAGLFAAIGARLAGSGGATRLFSFAFVAAALVTVTLSLDVTVVLLTPVVLAAASAVEVSSRPVQVVCLRLANSASLLLPVSNLTNLLAMPRLDLTFGRFALLMAPVWLVTLLVEYAAHRFWLRDQLVRVGASRGRHREVAAVPRAPVFVVIAMLAGFAIGSPLGVDPAWVAGSAALVLGACALVRGELGPRRLAQSSHVPFALYVLCLGVVVATLGRGPAGDVLATLVPAGDGIAALLAIALLGGVLANLVNNLPATLLLVPLVAPLGVLPVLAMLVGVNLGSSMTWSGSLANLLWRRTVIRSGGVVLARDFYGMSLLATPLSIALGVITLSLWAPWV